MEEERKVLFLEAVPFSRLQDKGQLYETVRSSINENNSESSSCQGVFWLHFGVNSGATRFAIENQAFNEATFRCPDEMGWKPQADGEISRVRQTSLPCEEISKTLSKKGYEVTTSDDAGRFVCNFVYHHSLRHAEQNGTKSLFVHVPLFLTIDEETQMQFATSLMEQEPIDMQSSPEKDEEKMLEVPILHEK